MMKNNIEHNYFCAYKSNYLFKFLPEYFRERPLILALAYFLVSYVGMYIIGYLTGQLNGNDELGILPMPSFIVDNINLALLAPVGAGLLSNLYLQINKTLFTLKNDEIINKNEISRYEIFLRKVDKMYNNKYVFIISIIFSILLNTYNYLNRSSSFLSIEGGITGAYGRFFIILNFTIIFLIIYKYCITIYLLKHIFKNYNLKISPLHPDRSAGLKSLGDLAISANYFMALVALFVTLLLVFDDFSQSTPFYIVLFIIYYPTAIISFFASLSGAHKKMIAKKMKF